MDEQRKINSVLLRGVPVRPPAFSHESRGERFFTFPLEVTRLSGTKDTLNILLRQPLMEQTEIAEAEMLTVEGEVRSFNNKSGVGSRLVISVYAHALRFEDGADENRVLLTGTICKTPKLRETPMGREICDMMLAVNRRYGRSDYIPCIAWGLQAREAALWDTGERIALVGRLQSRRYIKLAEGVQTEKTAFEVSVTEAGRV